MGPSGDSRHGELPRHSKHSIPKALTTNELTSDSEKQKAEGTVESSVKLKAAGTAHRPPGS
jgi:hypothetical protein